jgi:protein-tyrosine kinase
MSVIERTLNKLRQQQGAAATEDRSPTIARLSRPPVPESKQRKDVDSFEVSPTSFIEFDLKALGRAGLYSGPSSHLADEYRLIKRTLLRSTLEGNEYAPGTHSNLIMMASALPGDGKTFTSVNMSLSIANEKDWEVLLVDADCKNPQLSRLLGVAKSPGLLDALHSPDVALESLILGTNIDGLTVLPLGSANEHSAELLASSRMSALCDRLASSAQQRIVVFDSPPLLLTTESVILSSHMGQIVLVVGANKTPQRAVLEAIEKLDQDKAIGLVLNRADEGGEGMGYGSYAAYGRTAA